MKKLNSFDSILADSEIIAKALAYKNKAIDHCSKQEYFDALKKCSKCCSLFKTDPEQQVRLINFKGLTNQKAYEIMCDCYLYSSIAYIQLNQFDQATNLLNELIISDPSRVQSLVMRSRVYDMQGRTQEAINDLLVA
jgi:tetratricopeptide (TPR) repeat protein